MRRRNLYALTGVLVFTALVMMTGCDLTAIFGEGTLNLRFESSSRDLTIVPELDMDIVSYTITGAGPSGESFIEEDFDGDRFEKGGLASGMWEITVDGYNAGGTRIGATRVELTIKKNQTTSTTVTLRPLQGTGTFSGTVTWTDDQAILSNPQVWVTVRDDEGEDIEGISDPIQLSVSGMTANGSMELPTGWYELTVGLYEGVADSDAMEVWKGVFALRIVSGQTTYGNLEIPEDQIRFGTGGASIVIEEDMENPLSVSFIVAPESIVAGSEVTFTSTGTHSDTAEYRWYVDGNRQDENSPIFIYTFPEVGGFSVSLLVLDGGAMGGYGENYDVAPESGDLGTMDFFDDFSTDSRSDYEMCYNSNDNGSVEYLEGELGLVVSGWNGIQLNHIPEVIFSDYTQAIFKLSGYGDGTNSYYGQFTLHWTEFGNRTPGWIQLYRMNSFLLVLRGNKMSVEVLYDETSNENSHGEVIFAEEYPITLSENVWYKIELVRIGLNVNVYLDRELICTVQIPEYFLDVNMNLAFGVDTMNGYDAYVDSIGY
jgi:hypothetical protein